MAKLIISYIPNGIKGKDGYVTTTDQIVKADNQGNIISTLEQLLDSNSITNVDCYGFESLSLLSRQPSVFINKYSILKSTDGIIIFNLGFSGSGTGTTVYQFSIQGNTIFTRTALPITDITNIGPDIPWTTYNLSDFIVPSDVVAEQLSDTVPIKIATIGGVPIYAPTSIPTGDIEVEITPATANVLGGIKIGYTENGKNIPVKLDENNKAYVETPFIPGYVTNGNNYGIQRDSDNRAFVTILDKYIYHLKSEASDGVFTLFSQADVILQTFAIASDYEKAYILFDVKETEDAYPKRYYCAQFVSKNGTYQYLYKPVDKTYQTTINNQTIINHYDAYSKSFRRIDFNRVTTSVEGVEDWIALIKDITEDNFSGINNPTLSFAPATRTLQVNESTVVLPLGSSSGAGLLSASDASKLSKTSYSQETPTGASYTKQTFTINGVLYINIFFASSTYTIGTLPISDLAVLFNDLFATAVDRSTVKNVYVTQYGCTREQHDSPAFSNTISWGCDITVLTVNESDTDPGLWCYIRGNLTSSNSTILANLVAGNTTFVKTYFRVRDSRFESTQAIATNLAGTSVDGLMSSLNYNVISKRRTTIAYNSVSTTQSDTNLRKYLYTAITNAITYDESVYLIITSAYSTSSKYGKIRLKIDVLYNHEYESSTEGKIVIFTIKGLINYTSTSLKLYTTRTQANNVDNYKNLLIKAELDTSVANSETIVIKEIKELDANNVQYSLSGNTLSINTNS